MMMVCPRCGFSQPADRFCAQCGLDVSTYHPQTKPLWLRFLQNPTLHLSLIAIVIVFTIGYIFYSRSELLGKEVDQFLNDMPLLSRDASTANGIDPSASPADDGVGARAAAQNASATLTREGLENPNDARAAMNGSADGAEGAVSEKTVAPETATAASSSGAANAPAEGGAKVAANDLEFSFWEIPHDLLQPVLETAEKSTGSGDGRVLVWTKPEQAVKVLETVDGGGQRLEGGKSFGVFTSPVVLEDGGEGASYQFSMKLDASKGPSAGDYNLKLSLDWKLPTLSADPNAAVAAIESAIDSTATLSAKGMVLILLEPQERQVKVDSIKGANGPLAIFASEEFRNGATDWVLLIHSSR